MFDPEKDCYKYNKCQFCTIALCGGCTILKNPNNLFTLNSIKKEKRCFCCQDKPVCPCVSDRCVGVGIN